MSKPIPLAQGVSLPLTFRWATPPLVYGSISAKLSDTPLAFTVTSHGAPAAWSVAILDTGFDDIQPDDFPPDEDDFYEATATDANTLTFNELDASRFTGTYAAGGSIAYYTPVDLSGASAELILYDYSGTAVLTITATLDNSAKTISAAITAAQSAALDAGTYTYACQATDADDVVFTLDEGEIEVYAPGSPP